MLPWHHLGAEWLGNVSDKPASSLFGADILNIEPAGFPQTLAIEPRNAPKL